MNTALDNNERQQGRKVSHTPGPWTAGPLDRNFNGWIRGEKVIVCRVTFAVDSEATANAKLMAAAPALLAELQRLVSAENVTLYANGNGSAYFTKAQLKSARAAITRATE